MIITRERLEERFRRLMGLMRGLTGFERREIKRIATQLNECICRNCDKHYDARKARGEWTGFCSAKCQHEKARALGFRKGKGPSEYDILNRHHCVGSMFAVPPALPWEVTP